MKKVRSSQHCISINSCIELSKTQFLSVSGLHLKLGPGPWTLENLDPEKPGPRKIWTLKNLDPK